MIIKKCKSCKNSIYLYPSTLQKKYCSVRCRFAISYAKKIKCICCMASFVKRGHGDKYCSRKCYGLLRRKTVKLKCKNCKNPFYRKPSVDHKFCSIKCGRSASGVPGVVINIICLNCGANFKQHKTQSERKRKFCSSKCFYKGRSIFGFNYMKAPLSMKRAYKNTAQIFKKNNFGRLTDADKSLRNFIFAVNLSKQKIKGEKIPCLV